MGEGKGWGISRNELSWLISMCWKSDYLQLWELKYSTAENIQWGCYSELVIHLFAYGETTGQGELFYL